MEKEPSFIGPRSYTEEQEQKARRAIRQWREAGRTPDAEETAQTEEDKRMIGTIRDFLADELRELGFDAEVSFDSSQFHFYDSEIYLRRFPDKYKALTQSSENSVILNRGGMATPAQKFSTLLHEAIHLISFQRAFLEVKGKEKNIYDARLGYRLRSPWKKGQRDFFRGLNEVVTELAAYRILKKRRRELEERFGITAEDTEGAIYSYMEHANILNVIVKKIAKYRGYEEGEVWLTFLKGLYRGNLLHLKEVDIVFGKGSLRIVSLLSSCETEEKNKQIAPLVEQYFTAENAEERAAVKREIEKITPLK